MVPSTAFNIVLPKLIILVATGAVVPTFISILATSLIASDHVNITFSHVTTVHVFSGVLSGVDDDQPPHPHDDFLVHCATRFAHHSGIVSGKLGSHPLNTYPTLVGFVGASRVCSYFHVNVSTAVPQLLSNVIAYLFLS